MNKAARLISPEDQARARRVEARHAWLMEHDPQYRAAASLEAITLAKKDPGTRMGQLIAVAMEAYADRPALGRRATTIGTDPATGRRSQVLLDEFETVSFRDVWADVRGLANLRQHDESVRVRPGEFVCILGFAGAGYVIVDLGRPTSAPSACRCRPMHVRRSSPQSTWRHET